MNTGYERLDSHPREIRKVTCERCGKESDDVELVKDPYLEQVCGEEVECWLCSDCFDTRAGDI